MTYVALLRGINVGGANRVEMQRLAATFERAGMTGVRTYINSGNVIFSAGTTDTVAIASELERCIAAEFGFPVPVLVVAGDRIVAIAEALPDSWRNNDVLRCNVHYLWPSLDEPGVLEQVPIRDGIDEVRYLPGALLWRVDRVNLTRSGALRLMGTPLYQQMTLRNCNTARKLAELVVAHAG